ERCDYVKGNRFIHAEGLGNMPTIRRFASQILAFLTTLASGIPVNDPQCGYTATNHQVLEKWNWSKSWSKYGYPNYWLIELSKLSFEVMEVPVKSIYGEEKSKDVKIFVFCWYHDVYYAPQAMSNNVIQS
ncbi:hypothetical protein N9K60_05035, partial [Candidatus Poseidoniales archaeon]|nr:hypothetical protein [Candidatus Poseidoniales archaeon]